MILRKLFKRFCNTSLHMNDSTHYFGCTEKYLKRVEISDTNRNEKTHQKYCVYDNNRTKFYSKLK